ncbi:hypothetical protein BFRIG_01890 [Peribacillus frigoritolerans]|uniref:abortive infection system toxin AbiGii family protein n=1 Tax=Peribacillus frigoritolerans TaxID=450367 RepID=UPI0030D36A43
MFADFEKAFFKKNEMDKKIPKEIVQSLSENLPKGFKYTDIGKGAVGITPIAPELKLQGLSMELPKDFPKEISTIDELTEYLYRTQKQVRLKPDKNNCITLNDKTFKVNEFINFPLNERVGEEFEFSMVPHPFQPPFLITIEGNSIKKEFTIQRQPYADMNKSLFKSINYSAFEISYVLDEVEQTLHFNFKLNIEGADSLQEAIDVLKLYQSFIKGEVKLNGEGLPSPSIISQSEEQSILETIKFWEKASALQSKLNIKFVPDSQTERKDVILIEELYHCLINNKPYKKYIKINDLTLNGTGDFDVNDLINVEGLSFQFIENSRVSVLGVELELYSIVSFFDFAVKDLIKEDKSQYKLIIQPIAGKKMYQSVFHFCSMEEASFYQKNMSDINELQHAKVITID